MLWGILKLVAVVLFLYLTWRNLNDSYQEEYLISYSWLALLILVIGGRLTFGLLNWGIWNESWVNWFLLWQKPGFNYMGATLLFVGFSLWYCQQHEWKMWAFMEDITPIFLTMMLLMLLEEWVRGNFSLRILIWMAIVVFSGVIDFLVGGRYRSLSWYKSGKKGFNFFFVTAWTMSLMGGASLFFKDSLFVSIGYLSLSLISVVGLFILGEVLLIKGVKNG